MTAMAPENTQKGVRSASPPIVVGGALRRAGSSGSSASGWVRTPAMVMSASALVRAAERAELDDVDHHERGEHDHGQGRGDAQVVLPLERHRVDELHHGDGAVVG